MAKSPKIRTVYQCIECGKESPKMMGKCPSCGKYNTFSEVTEKLDVDLGKKAGYATLSKSSIPVTQIDAGLEERYLFPGEELNRVLGGGMIVGSTVLLAAPPGGGKSSLCTMICGWMTSLGHAVLYVSAEESVQQIKNRVTHFGMASDDFHVFAQTSISSIIEEAEKLNVSLVIVDSIQAVYTDESDSAPSSVTQVKAAAMHLNRFAKDTGVNIIIIGQVTKDDQVAGPKQLEHIVDTVLFLEGDQFYTYRILRVIKNRFGPPNEVGVFELRSNGMFEVLNPSAIFLNQRMTGTSGSAIVVTMEGTRPILLEVQGLVEPSGFSNPRRTPNGVDIKRLLIVCAVLSKHLKIPLHEQNVFLNIAGGMQVTEPAADLAMAMAIASSFYNIPLPDDAVFIGEVGLAGEVREVQSQPARIAEAFKMGFQQVYTPRRRDGDVLTQYPGQVIEISHVSELSKKLFPTSNQKGKK